MPADKAVHVILDSYVAHEKRKGSTWLALHQGFPSTHAELLLVGKRRRGLLFQVPAAPAQARHLPSVVDLQAAINLFVHEHTADDRPPFIWKANPDDLSARNREFQTLNRPTRNEMDVHGKFYWIIRFIGAQMAGG
ncbi:MAG: hypothetical protein EOR33_28060 [Mesorhizobium sp.]|nr:MAG: hypothetical protein EOR33_28060 [Mesorhizobium sp.]